MSKYHYDKVGLMREERIIQFLRHLILASLFSLLLTKYDLEYCLLKFYSYLTTNVATATTAVL